jgi:hypothetical protein
MGRVQKDENYQGYLKLSKKDVWVRVMPTELHDVHQRWVRYSSSQYVDIVTDSRDSEYGMPILVSPRVQTMLSRPCRSIARNFGTCH